jgi:hypothetical protein
VLVVNPSREFYPRRAIPSGAVGRGGSLADAPRLRSLGWVYAIVIVALCAEWLLAAVSECDKGLGTGNWELGTEAASCRRVLGSLRLSGSSEQLEAVARGRRRAASSCKQQAAASGKQRPVTSG